MINKLIAILMFSCLIGTQLSSQELNYKNYISINPISFLSPYHRSVDLAIGRKFLKNFHIEIGYAQIVKGGYWENGEVGRENDNGSIFKIESKYVFHKLSNDHKNIVNHFTSIKIYHTKHNYTSARFKDDSTDSITRYGVKSRVLGIIPHYGVIFQHRRYQIEGSVGYGIRKLNISNDYAGDIESLSKLYRLNERFEPEKNGKYFRGSISLNVKLGFCF